MSQANEKQLYKCPECGLHYEDEEIKNKCAAWCSENKSCNIEIARNSVEVKQKKAS